MNKPVGVLILAALIAFIGVSVIVMGIYFLTFLITPVEGLDRLYTIMVSLVSIGTGGIGIYIAKGLWDLKAWARTASMILLVFAFIGSIGGAVSGKPAPMAVLILSMAFLVYLLRNDVKASFTGSCQIPRETSR
ncbi:hypothetical protein DRP07_10325 [Archaeoglobales archaeon]|nr:MAG: hypothetical protein DRP07_10325 [Archaeoglobales archaeon]